MVAKSPQGAKSAKELHDWWTRGPGLTLWADAPDPWTQLRAHLLKYLSPDIATKTASVWFHDVFGFYSGSDLNRVTHGKPPRGRRIGPG